MSNSILAVRAVGPQNASSVYQDRVRLDASGAALFQSLHIGAGLTTNDTRPIAGLAVHTDGNLTVPSLTSTSTLPVHRFLGQRDANGGVSTGSVPALTVDGGKVVIGAGSTSLFSVDTSTGNVITRGTVTQESP